MTAEILFGPDQEENILYHHDYTTQLWIGRLFIADEPFVVTDQLTPFNWVFTGETKNIADYNCYAATTTFRERTYTAYFTPDIPISAGPYKFGGLPGLILEITADNKNFGWYCKSISPLNTKEAAKINSPNGKKTIDFQEYQQKTIEFQLRIMEKLRNSTSLTVGEPVIEYDNWLERPAKQ